MPSAGGALECAGVAEGMKAGRLNGELEPPRDEAGASSEAKAPSSGDCMPPIRAAQGAAMLECPEARGSRGGQRVRAAFRHGAHVAKLIEDAFGGVGVFELDGVTKGATRVNIYVGPSH